jgi:hypothetical protein
LALGTVIVSILNADKSLFIIYDLITHYP